MSTAPALVDNFGRVHDNLRISVTDRCNIRCFYCMPEKDVQFVDRREILDFEEIERFARIAAGLGITKIRVTGGEPLVRRDLPELIRRLSAIPGIHDLALTTDGEPDYLFDATYTASTAASPRETIPAAVGRFLRLGIEHIFLGYDHICFLLALIVVSRLGELVKIITSFTIAHSITLILAALKVVTLPQRFIECGVAATIVYVAVENLWRKNITHRWMLTFVFGLIHGFSFANVLAGLGLPREATIRCLLSFNVGVEIGQLIIVLTALPLVLLVSKQSYGAKVKMAVSVIVAIFGLGWFIERALRLGFMPI